MSFITLVAVGIVVAAIALLIAFAASLAGAEPPRASAGEARGVPVKLWCPTAGELTRVGIGSEAGDGGAASRLDVVWCDRFPAGPITCDRACLKAAA